jgi:hypothetical protein
LLTATPYTSREIRVATGPRIFELDHNFERALGSNQPIPSFAAPQRVTTFCHKRLKSGLKPPP